MTDTPRSVQEEPFERSRPQILLPVPFAQQEMSDVCNIDLVQSKTDKRAFYLMVVLPALALLLAVWYPACATKYSLKQKITDNTAEFFVHNLKRYNDKTRLSLIVNPISRSDSVELEVSTELRSRSNHHESKIQTHRTLAAGVFEVPELQYDIDNHESMKFTISTKNVKYIQADIEVSTGSDLFFRTIWSIFLLSASIILLVRFGLALNKSPVVVAEQTICIGYLACFAFVNLPFNVARLLNIFGLARMLTSVITSYFPVLVVCSMDLLCEHMNGKKPAVGKYTSIGCFVVLATLQGIMKIAGTSRTYCLFFYVIQGVMLSMALYTVNKFRFEHRQEYQGVVYSRLFFTSLVFLVAAALLETYANNSAGYMCTTVTALVYGIELCYLQWPVAERDPILEKRLRRYSFSHVHRHRHKGRRNSSQKRRESYSTFMDVGNGLLDEDNPLAHL